MIFKEIKERFLFGTTIVGANMEDIKNAEFCLLSESRYGVEYSLEELDIIKRFEGRLEELFYSATNGTKEQTEIHQMPTEGNKVVLKDGQVCHRCSPTIETLSNIAKCGVMASEWFGQRESAGEGFLCAFASKRFTSESKIANDFMKSSFTPGVSKCFLYFDEQNILMKELMDIDFFEYMHIKRTEPEKVPELYSPGIIELFDKIIEPMSPHGHRFHDSPTNVQYGWLAIPGGIPAALVNGICISSKSKDLIAQVEEIRKMYPNAVIFDENQNVIANALSQQHGSTHENT